MKDFQEGEGNPMIELSYCSKAVVPFASESLLALNRKARRKNKAEGISGVLTYDEARNEFFQIIEGYRDSVMHLMKSILADPRHTGIIVNSKRDITRRSYGDWTMCLIVADDLKSAVPHIDGVEDWMNEQFPFHQGQEIPTSRHLMADTLKKMYINS